MIKLLRNKRAQNTAEYAILIGLIIGALVTMQTYVKRSFQAKIKNAADYRSAEVVNPASGEAALFTGEPQYEPYYVDSKIDSQVGSRSTLLNNGGGSFVADSTDTNARTASVTNTYDNRPKEYSQTE